MRVEASLLLNVAASLSNPLCGRGVDEDCSSSFIIINIFTLIFSYTSSFDIHLPLFVVAGIQRAIIV